MRTGARAGLAIVLLCVVASGGYVVGKWRSRGRTTDDKWFISESIPLSGSDGAVSYTDDAILKADIPLPTIEAIDAKIKLLAYPPAATSRSLGYVTRVRIAPLDKKNIPAKYLQNRTAATKAGPVTISPLVQVTYAAQFSFDLLDSDGFTLGTVIGPEHWIESGKTSAFQEIVAKPVDLSVARRVAKFRTHLSILRCGSCQSTDDIVPKSDSTLAETKGDDRTHRPVRFVSKNGKQLAIAPDGTTSRVFEPNRLADACKTCFNEPGKADCEAAVLQYLNRQVTATTASPTVEVCERALKDWSGAP